MFWKKSRAMKKWKIEVGSHKKTSKGDEEIFLWRF